MSVTINGTSYANFTDAFTNGVPAAGVYKALPDVGIPPMFDLPVHDRRDVTFPGVPETGQKDYGGNSTRKRPLYIDLVVVGTATTFYTNLAALHTVIKNNTRYTVSFGGQSFDGCKMAGPHGPPIAYFHMRGRVVAVFRIPLVQMGTSN